MNLEAKRVYQLAYYKSHRDYLLVRAKKYRKKNKNRIAISRKRYQDLMRRASIAALGGKCIRCGFDDYRALQFDHVNSDGHLYRNARGSTSTYKSIAEGNYGGPEIQLLCSNCNWIKRCELGEVKKE